MINVVTIPCLSDNYAYLVENTANQRAILIDCPEAEPIRRALAASECQLEAVLITHHHSDHVDGLSELNIGKALICGAEADAHRLPKLDHELSSEGEIEIAGMRIRVMPADGHTIGHIAYYVEAAAALFSADSLMLWGCGRLFEGTPAQMLETLDNFTELPDETLIYSGHNYGVVNGRFALSLEPDAPALAERLAEIEALNAAGKAACPESLAVEKATNPFLRSDDDKLARVLGIEAMDRVERFAHIRELRNRF